MINIHLKWLWYDHYDFGAMKKAPSGLSPVIGVSKNASKSLHRQVYEGYRQAIMDGSLRAGQRVPSTRVLATELGISRIPVISAYAQLVAEGYFEGRIGSGTVVSQSLPARIVAPPSASRPAAVHRSSERKVSKRCKCLPGAEGFYRRRVMPFSVSQIAFEHFPLRTWNRLIMLHSRRSSASSLDYGDPMGARDLREAIATYLRTARGARCEAEQIMIVGGSQHGLEIAARVLLDPGDPVWMEEPGYDFARRIFAMSGCPVVPVPVDTEGLNVAAGVKKCPGARAVLVTPSHQYPLGLTMSASRRLQLLDWAETSRSWIIEDDYDSEYRYEGMPVTSLQGLDRNERVIYVGTFSKVLFPSLRIGYVVVPADLVERFLAVRFAFDISPPTFLQMVLADFIRDGHFGRHIRRMRSVYRERRDALICCLREELSSAAHIEGGQTGLHLCLVLNGVSDGDIAARAFPQNLSLTPLSRFYARRPGRQGLVLGFGSTPAEKMAAAAHKLALLIQSKP